MIEASLIAARLGKRLGRAAVYMVAGGASLMLAACSTGAPTYGTGTPSDEQLLQDLTGAISLAPKRQAPIDYKPRPDIVMPASTAVLPPPQEDLSTASNPRWPESPEQRLARVRAEATLNSDNGAYDPEIEPDRSGQKSVTLAASRTRWGQQAHQENPEQARRAFKRRLAETHQGSPTTRRYLSDPPLELRQPAASAPTGDLGEDEWKKKRDAERAAKNKSLPGRMRDALGL